MFPEKPDFTTEIKVEKLYQVLADYLDKDLYKDILYKIYEKATQLETKRQELLGKLSQKQDKIENLEDELDLWETGYKNILRGSFTKEERDSILDAWITMIHQHGEEDAVENVTEIIFVTTFMHMNGARSIAKFMEDMVESAKGRLIPQDEIFLDLSLLSEEEIAKLERASTTEGEVINLPKDCIRTETEKINIPGNHILLDLDRLDRRHYEAMASKFNRGGSSQMITIPATAFVKEGSSVDKSEFRTERFPEEKPGEEPEEADPDMYGEDHIGSKGNPNDELPFDE